MHIHIDLYIYFYFLLCGLGYVCDDKDFNDIVDTKLYYIFQIIQKTVCTLSVVL